MVLGTMVLLITAARKMLGVVLGEKSPGKGLWTGGRPALGSTRLKPAQRTLLISPAALMTGQGESSLLFLPFTSSPLFLVLLVASLSPAAGAGAEQPHLRCEEVGVGVWGDPVTSGKVAAGVR